MVALLRSTPVSATNIVRRNDRHAKSAALESRSATRHRLVLQAWLCSEEESLRGYVLDLSAAGARLGGVGTRLRIGQQLLAKVVLRAHEPPVLLAAEVVRYAPVVATDASACPELCIRFIGTGRTGGLSAEGLAAQERVEDFLATLRG